MKFNKNEIGMIGNAVNRMVCYCRVVNGDDLANQGQKLADKIEKEFK